jgi:hypothetical protein
MPRRCEFCQAEAVGRCYACGALFCDRHGEENCVRCDSSIAAGDPRPDRVSARPLGNGSRSGWWRPQMAEDYNPPACYECKGLARTVCRHCGSLYCADHAGAAGLCAACSRSSNIGLVALIGIVVLMAGLMIVGFFGS